MNLLMEMIHTLVSMGVGVWLGLQADKTLRRSLQMRVDILERFQAPAMLVVDSGEDPIERVQGERLKMFAQCDPSSPLPEWLVAAESKSFADAFEIGLSNRGYRQILSIEIGKYLPPLPHK